MIIALESLLFLLGGIALGALLMQLFGRGVDTDKERSRPPVVRLVRTPITAEGFEKTRLMINDRVILTASSQGLRPAAYADEVEYVEAIATRVASALGTTVELERMTAGDAPDEEEVLTQYLPTSERDRGMR